MWPPFPWYLRAVMKGNVERYNLARVSLKLTGHCWAVSKARGVPPCHLFHLPWKCPRLYGTCLFKWMWTCLSPQKIKIKPCFGNLLARDSRYGASSSSVLSADWNHHISRTGAIWYHTECLPDLFKQRLECVSFFKKKPGPCAFFLVKNAAIIFGCKSTAAG